MANEFATVCPCKRHVYDNVEAWRVAGPEAQPDVDVYGL